MAKRNWIASPHETDYLSGDMYVRGVSRYTYTMREIAEYYEQLGTEESLKKWMLLSEVADAVDEWFSGDPAEPFADARVLVDIDEIDIIAEAESDWFRTPGNSERMAEQWHQEYLHRMSTALESLTEAGYAATGQASRHDWVFRLDASHPELHDEIVRELFINVIGRVHEVDNSGFDSYRDESGLVVVEYCHCPPWSCFEPVVAGLVELVETK